MKIDFKQLKNGDRRTLGKALTLIESTKESDQKEARALLREANKHLGSAVRLAITGAPGVGKSTFIDTFGMTLVNKGKKIAVLAIDPSSPIHGGSLLGDKTRMERLSQNELAFIRPSPSKGVMGGVAPKTLEAITLCEAAGFDYILVETVGVGQSETEVSMMVDLTLLFISPGGGDDLQGIKKGIMEIADILVVNKADKNEKELAERTASDYRNALGLLMRNETPPVHTISALEDVGINDVINSISTIISARMNSNHFQTKRDNQNVTLFWHYLETEFKNKIERQDLIEKIRLKEIDPISAAEEVLKKLNL